ncbi:MAG: (Fe-S)-binding protein [Thermoplasmatota archaeon]
MSEKVVRRIIEDTRAFDCVECGKCTSVCPVTRHNKDFAPRLMVVRALDHPDPEALAGERDLWTCTTCGVCTSMCPYKVDYIEFIRALRAEGLLRGVDPECSQGGLLQSMMRVMARGELRQKRLGWAGGDLRVAERGELYYFTGCSKHLATVFRDRQGLDLGGAAEAAVRIMNAASVVPAVSGDEVCCGHDLNWMGDEESFALLADRNIAAIKATGARRVVFTCPEGLRTFKKDYPLVATEEPPFESIHISELMAEWVREGRLRFRETKARVTYHDACRLGRHMGVYDPPREVLRAIPGLELVELESSRERCLCCGVSGWLGCGSSTRLLQLDKLMEAKRTGAEVMLTFCPKCQIHLSCAASDKTPVDRSLIDIPVRDFTVFAAGALEWGGSAGRGGGSGG